MLLLFSGCMFPTPANPPQVIIYGDSLAVEAFATFKAVVEQNGIAQVVDRTQGSTAICDFLDDMEVDKETVLPSAVVLQFVGNTRPACMGGATGDDAVARYFTDAQQAIEIWKARGVKVFLVGPPAKVVNGGTPESNNPYRDMYFFSAVANNMGFLDAGHAAVWNPATGLYQFHMPCLPDEGPAEGCVDGLIQVRDHDGLHFCVRVPMETLPCNRYVPGARRYGFEMAAPLVIERRW